MSNYPNSETLVARVSRLVAASSCTLSDAHYLAKVNVGSVVTFTTLSSTGAPILRGTVIGVDFEDPDTRPTLQVLQYPLGLRALAWLGTTTVVPASEILVVE